MTESGPAALPEGWWAPALALAERPARADEPAPSQAVRDRVAAWRADFAVAGRFDVRLAADRHTARTLRGLLAESPATLAARVFRPAWADLVERAVAAAAPRPVESADWRAAFAEPLTPFVTVAAEDLSGRIAACADHVDVPAVVAAFTTRLSRHLVGLATRTLVHEHNARLAAGATTDVAGFAARLTEPAGLADLCVTYPVLARLLGQACVFQTDALAELLSRFVTDRAAIVAELLDGQDPGQVTRVRVGLGEQHRRGRSVAVLTFASGARVVYKPRDLGAHTTFATAVRWLNTVAPGIDLATVAAVRGDGYGWLEFVEPSPLADHAAADRFYRRQGALLVLLHALHAADMHFENVVARGDQPLLVDTETLFHPSLTIPSGAPDPAARTLADSVHRTGLLPIMTVGEDGGVDLSGLGGAAVDVVADWAPDEHGALHRIRRTVRRTAGNLPTADGSPVDVADHETALLSGFRQAYDAIVRHRAEFTDLLTAAGDVEVRIVARNSAGYARLLTESTRPELARDALRRDQAFDVLWTESVDHPLRWAACRHEQADLWAGDVPLFTARAGSPDLFGSAGDRLPHVLDRTGLACALAKVAAMSEIDRRDQEWIISAALATRAPAGDHLAAASVPGHLTGTAAPPERLLIAACTVADQIVARHLASSGQSRANWLGLELVDERQWLVLPMGASLGSGYLGVALFLAQVSELSGVSRYAAMARRALLGLPRLFDLLRDRPELVAAVGCGGFTGFGGIAYALARLTTLLGDDQLADATATAVDLAGLAARDSDESGVASGAAGCVAAMTAVHAELGLAKAARVAEETAARLAARINDLEHGLHADDTRPRPSGFLHGAAGIAWALADRAPEAAARAAAHAHARPGDLGWCTGAAGLAMAGAGDLDALLADRPVPRDLSLCHGELGVTEALTVLASDGGRTEPVAAARRGRSSLVLDAFTQYGATCGTPNGVSTPGLLTGLAGVGLGLLRLGYPERVPSVLLLAPAFPTREERNTDKCLTSGSTRTITSGTTAAAGNGGRGSSDSGRPRWPASSSQPAP